MKTFRLFISSLVAGLITGPLAAQNNGSSVSTKFKNRYSVGVGFAPEWQLGGTAGGKFSPSYGLCFDAQFSKHDGLEFSIFDRIFSYSDKIYAVGGPLTTYKRHNYNIQYVSLRLGYKFYSDVLNFSAGFNVDFAASTPHDSFVGDGFDKHIDRYGFYLSISKNIRLYKGLMLEPEIHANPFLCDQQKRVKTIGYEGLFLGLGVKLKYRF